MEWTEVTCLWIKPQIGGKDSLEANLHLKKIQWKGKKSIMVTRRGCRIAFVVLERAESPEQV